MDVVIAGRPSVRHIRPAAVAAIAVGVVTGSVGLTLKIADGTHAPADTAMSVLGGFLFLAAGVVAQTLRPANRTGVLMVLVGVAFFAEDIQLSTDPVVYSLGLLVSHAATPLLVHLVLAFPHGRLETRTTRWLTVAAYVAVFLFSVLGALFFDQSTIAQAKPANVLLVVHAPVMATLMYRVFDVIGTVIALGVIVALTRRFLVGGRELRVPATPALAVAVFAAAASGAGRALGPLHPLGPVLLGCYQVAFCLWPLTFLLGVLWVRPRSAALIDLLAAARGQATVDRLRETLVAVLRDPTLRLARWRAETDAYVDTEGRLVDPADGGLPLSGHDGRPVGLLHRREVPWEDARLAEAVAALTGLVLDNQRLAAEAEARLVEVRASRIRLVTAADEERRRVERDLHDGAQQRLVVVALGIELAKRRLGPDGDRELAGLLDSTAAGITAAIDELRELARGIHPALLVDAGLGPAVAELVDRTPVRVRVSVDGLPRLPAPVEATAYFVVAEALTNVLKHAGDGCQVDLALAATDDLLRVEVADDGVGGAIIETGSGLGGLRDRVRALDGELTVCPSTGSGTTVIAEIPLR